MIEYLATPYSDKDHEVMAYRAEVSDLIYAELTKQGRIIYPPISCNHIVGIKYGLPKDWKFWSDFDLAFVSVCSRLLVITLPGWGASIGVTDEIKKAKEMGIPIEFIDPTTYLSKLDPHYMKRAYLDGTIKPLPSTEPVKRGRGRPRKIK